MEGKKPDFLLKIFVSVSFIAMIVVNALANILPINGIGTGAVSDAYPNLFAPAGLTFSIWGLIYILLAAHTLYQLGLFRSKNEKVSEALLRQIGIVFALTSLINAAWIFSWHYRIIPLSMILMVCLLVGLIDIRVILQKQNLPIREKILIRLPFSVYLGWITVATIANATTLLVSIGWDRFSLSEVLWTIIMLSAGTLIGAATIIRFKDLAYGLVLVWAYAGILIKHTTAAGFSGQYPGVVITVSICLALFIAALFYTLFAIRNKAKPAIHS